MLLLKASLQIDPSTRDTFLSHLADFVAQSRAEDGCLGFHACEDVLAPNRFLILEEWDSPAALEKHETSAHVAAFKVQIAAFITVRTPTIVYAISESRTL
jgi:quinol monooxygenase YgiN